MCRDGDEPGDYVQWTPLELAYLHDWNVILVPDGRDFQQIAAAQRRACTIYNAQPTAIVYRTTKGWQYGIEGRASHGAGHTLCSDGFYEAVRPLLDRIGGGLPACEAGCQRCDGGHDAAVLEECLWEALLVVRKAVAEGFVDAARLAGRLVEARERLNGLQRRPRAQAPDVEAIYRTAAAEGGSVPEPLVLESGTTTTLRAELGKVLNYYNVKSEGAILAAAADLLGSTSVKTAAMGFPDGYYNSSSNPGARLLSVGGICEDAMSGLLAGLSTYGQHIGAGSSYSFHDDNSNLVKVALKGSAQAQLRLGADSQPDIQSIRFLSDSDTGKLTITSKAGAVQLGDITGTVSLTSFKAANAELVGDIDIDGYITKLQLGSMTGDATLDYSAEKPASLRLGTVTDNATINIDGPVRSLRADQLAGDCFTSDSISRMLVARTLDMDVNVTAGNLGKLDVRTGDLNSNIQVNGTVGKINIRQGSLNGSLDATGDIGRISLRKGDITGTIYSAATIGRITANNMTQANITAAQGIDRLSIREAT